MYVTYCESIYVIYLFLQKNSLTFTFFITLTSKKYEYCISTINPCFTQALHFTVVKNTFPTTANYCLILASKLFDYSVCYVDFNYIMNLNSIYDYDWYLHELKDNSLARSRLIKLLNKSCTSNILCTTYQSSHFTIVVKCTIDVTLCST